MLWLVGLGLVPLTARCLVTSPCPDCRTIRASVDRTRLPGRGTVQRSGESAKHNHASTLTRMTRGRADQIRIKIRSTRGEEAFVRIALEGGSPTQTHRIFVA